jgi:hypothetical protein
VAEGAEIERSEIEAVLETRRELGQRYDAELVDGFADRIQAAVEVRVAANLQARRSAGPRQLALGIVSLGAGIPITAINLAVAHTGATSLVGLLVSWGGIAAVNIAHALQGRQR